MGRSVSTPSNAMVVTFTQFESDDEWDYVDYQFAWHDYKKYFQERIIEMFPTSIVCDTWLHNEDHALAENALVYFGISEYCGIVSLWIAGKDEGGQLSGLRDRWVSQNAQRFVEEFGSMQKVGTFSNGEAVYQKVK